MKRRNAQKRRQQRQRGSAMVEFSVLMLAFVPLILLPLYFVDAMRYKLEAQEAVYMSVWDFAFADYTANDASGFAGGIDSKNKELYRNFKAGDEAARSEDQHLGIWADARWGTELDCTEVDKEFGAGAYGGGVIGALSLAENYHDEFTKGGLVTCKGNIEVANLYIPSSFVDEGDSALASGPLFNQKKVSDDGEEGEGEEGPGKDAGQWLPYKEIRMGLMVDPWCIHETGNIIGECDDGEFCKRVNYVWKEAPLTSMLHMTWALGLWLMFGLDMMLDINFTTVMMMPDNPMKLKMSVKHPPTEKRHEHFLTPMEDGQDNEHSQSYDARESYFMGCESFERGKGGNCSFGS